MWEGTLHCLKGASAEYYEENVNILYETFGEENCNFYDTNEWGYVSVDCEITATGFNAGARSNGTVYTNFDHSNCGVYNNGSSFCEPY